MPRFFHRLSLPLQIFVCQLFLIFACALLRLENLTLWDGKWYAHIVRHGYSATLSADPTVPNLGNVGFFPGYPLFGWLAKEVIGFGSDLMPPEYGLLTVSFISVALIWSYSLKWLTLFGQHLPKRKVILFALYPFSIFFYYAYSEALYCLATLCFFYYSELFLSNKEDASKRNLFLAALACGIVMDATRLFGVVFVLYPILRAFQLNRAKPASVALALGSLFGLGLFFVYCQQKFGHWDLYFISKKVIWGNAVDLHKLFPPTELFNFSRPLRADTTGKYVAILLGGYLIYRLVKILKARDFKNPHLALILVSGMYWGETLLAMTSWNFSCLGRYLLPLLVLQLPFFDFKPRLNWKWGLVGLIFLSLQIAYALKFARYGWVA